MSVIELKDVSVTFHEGGRTVEAVKHVTLNVDKGEIFGIVGFSGAGKSTLVRTINLLERPTGGQVVIDGNDITGLRGADLRGLRKKIGFIFQGFNLIGNVTVGKNIEFALKAGGYPKPQWQERIRELLTLVGLENKIDSYPSSLSGGQKQATPSTCSVRRIIRPPRRWWNATLASPYRRSWCRRYRSAPSWSYATRAMRRLSRSSARWHRITA